MFTFDINETTDKQVLKKDLVQAAEALTEGEPDAIANMANLSSLTWQYPPDRKGAGFYRMIDGELVLGPFQGKAACIRIAVGAGVCGAAAQSGETQCVDDVHAFPGHIACDGDSRSELVVPIIKGGKVVAVLDLDSPLPSRFDADDVKGGEAIARLMAGRV